MKRDPDRLADGDFDLLVIGGGVLGASVARDAALRGLAVALVERSDFGGATSANSLKTLHGGLRYLAAAEPRQMRAFIRERTAWLRIAPHLAHPLPVLIPAQGHTLQGRALLRVALAINDALSWDRNQGLNPDRQLPGGRALARRECIALVPEFGAMPLTGGVLFHDAQLYSTERAVLGVVEGAIAAGAVAANYMEATAPIRAHGTLAGVEVTDRLSGATIPVRARAIVVVAGSSSPAIVARLAGVPGSDALRPRFSTALNIVIPGLGHPAAFALRTSGITRAGSVEPHGRRLFVVPWRGRTMIGTGHFPFAGNPNDPVLAEADVARFVAEVNMAWPGAPVTTSDILLVHHGLQPSLAPTAGGDAAQGVALWRRHRITDHALGGSGRGRGTVISAVGVKFTTARLVAEQVVDLAIRRLGVRARPCETATTPLPSAPRTGFSAALAENRARWSALPADVVEHAVHAYGQGAARVLARAMATAGEGGAERVVPGEPVITAQLDHALEEEMAITADDLLHRRTELGARGPVPADARAAAVRALGARRTVSDEPRSPRRSSA